MFALFLKVHIVQISLKLIMLHHTQTYGDKAPKIEYFNLHSLCNENQDTGSQLSSHQDASKKLKCVKYLKKVFVDIQI